MFLITTEPYIVFSAGYSTYTVFLLLSSILRTCATSRGTVLATYLSRQVGMYLGEGCLPLLDSPTRAGPSTHPSPSTRLLAAAVSLPFLPHTAAYLGSLYPAASLADLSSFPSSHVTLNA